ncbi:amino acid adenylation domain-containing protein [Actinosynnema sp. CS-041913]|uniref:amino acid adenylation domain-containing protein n=1 Tax=Actinosynnema sp. CS-041913 TaxID=3239917 RepID=UPI003D8AE205
MTAPQLPLSRNNSTTVTRRTHRMPAPRWRSLRDQADRAGSTPSAVLLCAYARTLGGWCRDQRFSIGLPDGYRAELDVDPRRSFLDCAKDLRIGPGEPLSIAFSSRLDDRTAAPRTTERLWHEVSPDREDLLLTWESLDEQFAPDVVDGLVSAHLALLDRLAHDPESWTGPAPEILPARQARVRDRVNDTTVPVDPVLLHEPFWRQTTRTPDASAVITSGRTVTYRQLRAAAHHLANRVTGPGTRVAIVMDKGWEQVAAALGILAAGAAYVPVDPGVPADRLHYLLHHAGATVVLTKAGRSDLDWPPDTTVVGVDDTILDGDSPDEPPTLQGNRDLAYIIYTSGSTGRPKGVMIDHLGAVNTVTDVNRRWQVTAADRVFALSALGFDLSVYDIFGPLALGGALVMPDPGTTRSPWEWTEAMSAHHVTIWNTVPALMEMLVEYTASRRMRLNDHLRLVLMSGDWIPVSLPDRIRSLAPPDLTIVGLGGATEASIWSNFHPIGDVDPAAPSIPYGTPLANQTFEVLDPALRRVPDWVPGELHIGGLGVAMGYWRDEDKTAQSFIRHPRTGQRLYRTGDIGRYFPDGTLEFLGREDFQVKIHGFRVELGEIEATLLTHSEVTAAVVTAVDTDDTGKRLVAYISPSDIDPQALRRHLTTTLPAYLVPDHIIPLDSFPLSSNGKVDRAALPDL